MVTASCAARRTPSGTRTHNARTHNARRRQRNVSPRASQGSDSVPGIVPVDGELWARVQKQCEKDGVDSHKLVESLLSNWVKERDGFAEKTGTFAAAGQLERIFGRDEIAQLESALARAGEAANAAAREKDLETLQMLNDRIAAAVTEAQNVCAAEENNGNCAVLWDEVDELSNARNRYEKRLDQGT
ncbi:hypothetical protein PPROV_000143700 [Pycnococcus provasolii]|uniref:Uncharacterized protein n=1 Tax=Pycnococcus provasolii TaxID=41880 RepID=A0A830H7Z0_9CHLO|nr:hypothetical protein PPROV_000143700 [Pycnococcus provasolii]